VCLAFLEGNERGSYEFYLTVIKPDGFFPLSTIKRDQVIAKWLLKISSNGMHVAYSSPLFPKRAVTGDSHTTAYRQDAKGHNDELLLIEIWYEPQIK
jgi:hypothetical protein